MINETLRLYRAALKNLLAGSNALSLSLIGHPSAMVGYASECWFLLNTYADRRGLRQRSVPEVLGNPSATVTVRLAPGINPAGAWFKSVASYTVDIVSLCMICAIIKPKVIFEIGTFDGFTSLHLALNSSSDALVHTLDLPASESSPKLALTNIDVAIIQNRPAEPRYLFEGSPEAARIRCLAGDSATFDYEPYRDSVDLFFIDGAHSYEYVRSDTLNALKCCHSGSVVAWHDFGRTGVNGVSKWLLELAREHAIYSVPGGSLAFMVVNR